MSATRHNQGTKLVLIASWTHHAQETPHSPQGSDCKCIERAKKSLALICIVCRRGWQIVWPVIRRWPVCAWAHNFAASTTLMIHAASTFE